MRIAAALCIPFLAAGLTFGAIDGTVTNGTSNQPQPNVTLTLVKPGQGGMRTLGTTTSDPQGRFHFEKDEPGGGPQLIQVDYQGATYTTLLTPNVPTSGVDVRIYEATKSPAVTRIAQHMILVEPSQSQTAINETLIVENATKQTYANPELGGIRFYLPPAADGQVRVSAQGAAGMPIPRPAIKTNESNVFKVDFPVKPGETQFSLSYVLPVGSPETLRGRIVNIKGQPPGPVRFVVPPGVTLESKDIQSLGQEPRTQALIYNLIGTAYTVDVKGMGTLTQDNNADQSDADVPQVVEANPPVYHHLGWLLGLALGVLTLGLLLLYRSSPIRAAGK